MVSLKFPTRNRGRNSRSFPVRFRASLRDFSFSSNGEEVMYHHRASLCNERAIFNENVDREENNPRIRRDKGENNNFAAYEIVEES